MKRSMAAVAVAASMFVGGSVLLARGQQTTTPKSTSTTTAASTAAAGQQAELDRLEKELGRARASGDPAQIAAAQNNIDKFRAQLKNGQIDVRPTATAKKTSKKHHAKKKPTTSKQ